ncbi:MAG: amino acid ABC transporter substrate-binding protein [Gammaproteobacteria bacterium]|nr:amino acid ABC transporter substrate-binding protein [Gammaproteobacteria bacterium]
MRQLVAIFLSVIALAVTAAQAATLDRIKETGVIKLGYREDAAPYSFKNDIGEPAGYTVDLCRAVAASLKRQLSLDQIDIQYVAVTAENRFEAVQSGRIDLLCGATTATLERRKLVDFSIGIFVDGASVMLQSDGPDSFRALNGLKVGVRGGTTTEAGLRDTLKSLGVNAEVVAVKSHGDGLKKLQGGDVSAYFADRAILLFLMMRSDDPAKLRVSSEYFSYEPYALALPRGDDDFRLAVDTSLSRLYRTGAIAKVFENAFGKAEPSDLLKAMYLINSLPE